MSFNCWSVARKAIGSGTPTTSLTKPSSLLHFSIASSKISLFWLVEGFKEIVDEANALLVSHFVAAHFWNDKFQAPCLMN